MKTNELIIEEINLPEKFGITESATAERERLILAAREAWAITLIENMAQANSIGEAARDIQTKIKEVRDTGMELRRPLNAACAQLKKIEDEYLKPLEAEKDRLQRLVTDYAEQERVRVAAEEETRRLEIEALQAKADNARTEKGREKAQEAKRAVIVAPMPESHRISGMPSRQVVYYAVEDKAKLLAARPELFKIEEKPSAIKAVCFPSSKEFTKDKPDRASVPGLALWYEWETSTRKW